MGSQDDVIFTGMGAGGDPGWAIAPLLSPGEAHVAVGLRLCMIIFDIAGNDNAIGGGA